MHFSKILQIFGGLVLGCIKTKFCKKICVRQHFSSSTRFASFCTAAISKFSQKIGLKNQQFSWNFSKFLKMSQNLQNLGRLPPPFPFLVFPFRPGTPGLFGALLQPPTPEKKCCQISKISARWSGRFWEMLQSAYLIALIGADTAENERNVVKNLPKIGNYPTPPPGGVPWGGLEP